MAAYRERCASAGPGHHPDVRGATSSILTVLEPSAWSIPDVFCAEPPARIGRHGLRARPRYDNLYGRGRNIRC